MTSSPLPNSGGRNTRRAFLAHAFLAVGAASSARGDTATGWDDLPEIRPAGPVAAAAGVQPGQHFQLGPNVTSAGYLNHYTITSDYGPFTATSDARLRRLAREIAAITQLKAMEQTDAFGHAALEAGKSPFKAIGNLIDDPVGTLSAVPEGIGSIFDRASESFRRGGRSQYEDGPAKQLLAVSGFKRDLAVKLGIDVYSSNETLQRELNRVAWAEAAGNLTLGALSAVTGAVVLKAASDVRMLDQARNIVAATPPADLSKRNREALRQMQVQDAVIDRFLNNRALSPRHQTIIVASLMALGDIPGRAHFIAYASGAENEDAALLFQQMAELVVGYTTAVAPVPQIIFLYNLPVAVTAKGSVMLLPIDRLPWTERTAAIARNLAATKPRGPEIWLTGDASARAEAGLKQLGLSLKQRCAEKIALLD